MAFDRAVVRAAAVPRQTDRLDQSCGDGWRFLHPRRPDLLGYSSITDLRPVCIHGAD